MYNNKMHLMHLYAKSNWNSSTSLCSYIRNNPQYWTGGGGGVVGVM